MIIDQGDLLWGMSMIFVKEFMDITIKESHEKGEFLFSEGDQATHFYTLITGRVKLSTGNTGEKVYTVSRAGELFGWSTLVDRDYYSASAECIEPTVLLKIERDKLYNLLEKYPKNGFLFYKKLAGVLGNRLIQCYKMISPQSE